MFKIYKGGEYFFQWDLGQRVIVEDEAIVKVHFCNNTNDCSLACEVYEEKGLRLANVPNILLQSNNNIRVYGCIEDGEEVCFSKTMEIFRVISRNKPEDYTYTEEELKNWDSLEARIAQIEENIASLEEEGLDTINSRIDNIIANNADTGSNTELIDIRVGADGTTYDSAGEAVREQVSKLSEDIDELISKHEYIFNGVNIIPENAQWSDTGFICNSLGTISYSEYAGSMVGLILPIQPNTTLKFEWFYGNYFLYDENCQNGIQYNKSNYDVTEIEIDENTYFIGLNVTTSAINVLDDVRVLRMTLTDKDTKDLYYKLPKLIHSAHPLKDKIIVNFGDSIFGQTRPPYDISTKLAELTGATVYNCGFGGCQMGYHADGYDAFSMYRLAESIASGDWSLQDNNLTGKPTYFTETVSLLKEIDWYKVDIITVAYGTNDYSNGLVPYDHATFNYGVTSALEYSVEKILGSYPHIKIFLCTPIYRWWNDTEDSDNATKTGWVHENTSIPFLDYVNAIKEKSKELHLPCIDNYYELGINKYNRLNYFNSSDGTHPNYNGNVLIAEHIAKKIW